MRRITVLLSLYFLAITPVAAADDSFSLYSDACWHAQAGDLVGSRIGILRLSDAAYVFLQAAEGDWNAPSVGKLSAADLKQGKLVFAVSDGGKPVSFRGTVTEKTIAGQFNGWFGNNGKPLVVQLSRTPASKKGVSDCH